MSFLCPYRGVCNEIGLKKVHTSPCNRHKAVVTYLSLAHKCPQNGDGPKNMSSKGTGYYLIRKRAVPEVLQKVVEVNKLLASGGARTVNEAAEKVGISRSSYYKFKDDVEEFHDSSAGTTLTLFAEINDETGLLSDMLGIIAEHRANILTIHQSIPLNGVASEHQRPDHREHGQHQQHADSLRALPGCAQGKSNRQGVAGCG